MSVQTNRLPAEPVSGYRMRHIPELDGIRGIAALVVFFHHLCYSTLHLPGQAGWPPVILWLFRVFEFGDRGVDLFFVLSGFLITSVLIQDRRVDRYYQDFYWKRALRIVPLYVVMLAIVALTMHQAAYVWMSLFFVVNFASVFHVVGFGPFWSLAIEEQFYLVWPTVVRRKNVSAVRQWALVLGVSAMALRLAFAARGHYNYYLTPLRCDGLAFGAVLACHFQLAAGREKARRSWDGGLAGVMAVGVALLFSGYLPVTEAIKAALLSTGAVLVTGPMIGLAISRTGAEVMAPLRTGALPFFGLISYALYMVHLYLVTAYDHVRGTLAAGDVRGYWVRLGVVFALTLAASLISRYAIELPALGLRRFVLRHPKMEAETEKPPLPLAQM